MNQLAQINFNYLSDIIAPNFIPSGTLGDLLSNSGLVGYVYFGAGVLLMLYLISAGFQFMTSGGDPKKISSAQQKITNALLGFAIVFFSYLIVRTIALILGLEGVSEIFGGNS